MNPNDPSQLPNQNGPHSEPIVPPPTVPLKQVVPPAAPQPTPSFLPSQQPVTSTPVPQTPLQHAQQTQPAPGTAYAFMGAGALPPASKPAKKKLLLIVIGAVVVIGLAVGGFFGYKAYTKNQNEQAAHHANETSSSGDDTSESANDQSRTQDTERETDIEAIHGQLEVYYAQYGTYPPLADLNSRSWRANNMKGFDEEALKDPEGTTPMLVSKPAAHVYSYDKNGNNYTLTATMSNGSKYTKSNLNY